MSATGQGSIQQQPDPYVPFGMESSARWGTGPWARIGPHRFRVEVQQNGPGPQQRPRQERVQRPEEAREEGGEADTMRQNFRQILRYEPRPVDRTSGVGRVSDQGRHGR